MKKIILSIVISIITIVQLSAQVDDTGITPPNSSKSCLECYGTSARASGASSIGLRTVADGANSFVGGINSSAIGSGSFAFGNSTTIFNTGSNSIALGNNSSMGGSNSFLLGDNLQVTANNAVLIGNGNALRPLINNINNSIMLGVSIVPSITIIQQATSTNPGYVGIGTSSPNKLLHVKGDIQIESNASETNKLLFKRYLTNLMPDGPPPPTFEESYDLWNLYSNEDGFNFKRSIFGGGLGSIPELSQLLITNEGKVGIGGVRNPTEVLEVAGNIKAIDIRANEIKANNIKAENIELSDLSNSTNKLLKIDANGKLSNSTVHESRDGKIGIGTSAPTKTLEVAGEIQGTNITLSDFNTKIGKMTKIGTAGKLIESQLYESTGGRIGIKTTDPKEDFQIGDIWTFHNGGTKYIARNIRYTNGQSIRIENGNSSLISYGEDGYINMVTYGNGSANSTLSAKGNIILNNEGNVGIGTTNIPSEFKLAINGKIICEELVVQLKKDWPDYVFEDSYNLRSLKDLEVFIKENKHLPEIPAASQIEETGLEVAEMNVLLLKKVEELTLYIIEQESRIQALENNK